MSINEELKLYLDPTGVPVFNKKEWSEFNKKYDKEEIKVALINHLSANNVEFPFQELDINEVLKLFKKCQSDTCEIINTPGYSKFAYNRPFDNIVFMGNASFNKISDYFQRKNRYACHTKKYPAPIECWNSGKRMREILKVFWNFKEENINRGTWIKSFQIGGQIASQFRVGLAKNIYDIFKAKKVLDCSSGWGDRLAGFYCSNAEEYIGIDPSQVVYESYHKQIEFYNTIIPKKTKIFNLPAEDVNYEEIDNDIDLVFTSPPYFSTERYSDEDTQSWKRYTTIEDWKYKFLFPVLKKAWTRLRVGGHMVINISDVLIAHKRVDICDEMVDYMLTFDEAVYVGYYGMRLIHRPNMQVEEGVNTNGMYIEPLWIVRKGGTPISFSRSNDIDDLFE